MNMPKKYEKYNLIPKTMRDSKDIIIHDDAFLSKIERKVHKKLNPYKYEHLSDYLEYLEKIKNKHKEYSDDFNLYIENLKEVNDLNKWSVVQYIQQTKKYGLPTLVRNKYYFMIYAKKVQEPSTLYLIDENERLGVCEFLDLATDFDVIDDPSEEISKLFNSAEAIEKRKEIYEKLKIYDSKKILEIYLGGTGLETAKRNLSKKDKYVLDTMDKWSIDECNTRSIPFTDMHFDNGLDGGYDWESRFEYYKTKEKELTELIKKYDRVLLVCGLGGGTGSSLYIYVSNLCERLNITCDAIVTLPFDFEGYRRICYSIKALNMGNVDNIMPIDLKCLNSKFPKEMPMLDVFKYVDYLILEFVKYYEENDIDTKEIETNYYSNIINNVDERWIERTREKMKDGI